MELHELRARIDEIDAELIRLFAQRMKVASEVAAYKREKGLPVLDESRERQKLNAVAEAAPEGMGDDTRILFAGLMDLSRAYQTRLLAKEQGRENPLLQTVRDAEEHTPKAFPTVRNDGKPVRVACQGTWGAYSQCAADRLFGKPDILFFSSFDAVFGAVEKGMCDYGIIPAENNTAGSVTGVWDLMTEHSCSIVRSARIKIDHSLLAKPGTKRENVREILSHEQALAQCRVYLEKNFPDARLTPWENTAGAAEAAASSDRCDLAVLASPSCADQYGLEILEGAVQPSDNNRTRFFCIAKQPEIYPGADRSAWELTLDNKPGSLYRALARFYVHGVNLTRLESRPIPGTDFRFRFFCETEADTAGNAFRSLLDELASMGSAVRYLGSYTEIQ